MPSEYQQDYKKACTYAPKIYNDPNMPESLRDIYRTLESRYVHEGRTIDPSFYNDLSDDSVAKFTAIGFDCLLSLDKQICPRTVHEKIDKEGNTIHKLPNQIKTNELFDHLRPCELVIRENVYSVIVNRDHTQAVIALMLYLAYFIIKRMYFFGDRRDKVLPYGMILTCLLKKLKENMAQGSFDERYKLVPKKMSSLKAKQPKNPPPKRTRNVGKSKDTQLITLSSTESPPSDDGELPSTKLYLSYKDSSDNETSISGSDDEEYAMAVRNFKKFFSRKGKFVRQPREENKSFRKRDKKKGKSDQKCFRCGDPNHLIGVCPKPSRNKDQKVFIRGSWSDNENDAEDKTNDETCLMAQSSNDVIPNSSYYSDNASSLDNDTMQIEYDSLLRMI
ncbi:retrovirus-related pol polyprotein from transposon TNT 1-94 [Tanacetum coccineum]|uniref:Retrovirus-related pol polyprotein from transposon TNT 1-94 n=1 Tax=Tanacetum coccineum TaxID=301880 RepID=A0ABQ4ZPH1_9ASTR